MTEIRRYELLDSTNEEARRLAAKGEHGPLWVIAQSQTEGRGRHGKNWLSYPGNLFASLLVKLESPLETCGQLSFVAALAVGDVVAGYVSGAQGALKWPNDILLNERKVAGILLETVPSGAASLMIVGCGINLAHYPGDTDFPAAALAKFVEEPPSPEASLIRLVAAWDTWYEIWRKSSFKPIRSAWLARARGVGERLTVRLGGAEIQGVFENLDDDGTLLLRTESGGTERITAGDVFFAN